MDAPLRRDVRRGVSAASDRARAVGADAAGGQTVDATPPAIARAVRPSLLTAVGVILLALNLRIATSEVPPVLPDLPLGDFGRATIVTIPVICFSLAAFAGPFLRALLGEERGLFALVTVLLFGTALRPFWGEWSLLAGTVVTGLAVAVMNVMMPSIVRRRFPRHIGEMTAAYTVALSIGSGLAAGLTVPLVRALGGSVAWGLAAWAAPAAVALMVWLPQLRWRRSAERASGFALGILKSRLAWQITFYFGLQSMVWYTLLSWLPAIYRDRGLDAAAAGALLGVVTAFGIVGNVAAPLLASRLGDPRPVVLVACLLTMGAIAGILAAPPQTAVLWALLLAVGTAGSFSLSLLLMASRHRDAARLSSMAQGFGYVMAAFGPLLAGFLHSTTRGWTVPLLATIGISVLQLAAGLMVASPSAATEPP